MIQVLQVTAALVIAAYPLLVFFGLQVLEPGYIAGLLVALVLLRVLSLRNSPGGTGIQLALAAILAGIGTFTLVADNPNGFRFYPVAVNLVFLTVFYVSLVKGIPVIERIARLAEPDLPANAISYTRKVTVIWCVFFVLNGSIALYTAVFTSFEIWAYYNGFLAYIIMALLLTIEWLVRRSVRRRMDATPQ